LKEYTNFYLMVLVSYLVVILPTFFCGTTYALATEQVVSTTEEKSAHSEISPMVEKHIFSPEPDSSLELQSINSPDGNANGGKADKEQQSSEELLQKVKREIELTGIIITPESKRAMILYKGKGEKSQIPEVYGAGTSIHGYLLKEIAPNYVMIAQNQLEVKVELFKERDDRPESPKEVAPKSDTAKPSDSKGPPENKESGKQAQESSQDGTLPTRRENTPTSIKPLQEKMQGDSSTNGNGNMGNPFLQAIQRARERQQSK